MFYGHKTWLGFSLKSVWNILKKFVQSFWCCTGISWITVADGKESQGLTAAPFKILFSKWLSVLFLQSKLLSLTSDAVFVPQPSQRVTATSPLWSTETWPAVTAPGRWELWWSSPVTPATRWSKDLSPSSVWTLTTLSGTRLSRPAGVREQPPQTHSDTSWSLSACF